MSADTETTNDRRDDPDPYDIVPDGFMDEYPSADSISEALRLAEQAASETDPEEFPRCPLCLSTRLRQKPGTDNMPHKRDEGTCCTGCGEHLHEPLPPLVDARRTADHAPTTDRETKRPRCRACLSTDLYPVPEKAPLANRWACLDCGAQFDDALPSYNETIRGDATSEEKKLIGQAMQDGGRR